MTLNAAFKDSFLLELESTENKSVENATIAIKNGFANFYSTVKEEVDHTEDYEKMLDLTVNAIKKYSNSQYKFNTSLEPNEIEQIKKALISYVNNHEKAGSFKKEILEDLTAFQGHILANHKQKITELTKEKEACQKQLRIYECDKHKLIMDRLSKIIWPYDEKTREYDQKITQLQTKVEQYIQKIENLNSMRPAANERDILIYNLHLKERFANRKE